MSSPAAIHATGGITNTETEVTQHGTEQDLLDFYSRRLAPELQRRGHASYLKRNILAFANSSQGLHCSQPWLVYWTLHAADVLGLTDELYTIAPPKAIVERVLGCYVVEGVYKPQAAAEEEEANTQVAEKKTGGGVHQHQSPKQDCINEDVQYFGGFGGGQGQLPHLAASYASVMSLAIVSERYPEVVDLLLSDTVRQQISNWMRTLFISPVVGEDNDTKDVDSSGTTTKRALKQPTLARELVVGSFRMHTGGESDIRASFTVATITSLLRFPSEWTSSYINPTSIEFVKRCFTFEGGVACSPLSPEAHGGYVSLGLTALVLWGCGGNSTIDGSDVIEAGNVSGDNPSAVPSSSSSSSSKVLTLHNLGRWVSARQCSWEGGFNGRTNKLVDSCYSYWVGAAVVLYEGLRSQQGLKEVATASALLASSSGSDGDDGGASSLAAAAVAPPFNYNVIDELRLESLSLPTLAAALASTTPAGDNVDDSVLRRVLEEGAQTSVEELMITDKFLAEGNICRNDSSRQVEEPPKEDISSIRHLEDDMNAKDAQDAAAFQPANDDQCGSGGGFYSLVNQRRLQQYVYKYCQNEQRGGLMDKPYCPNDSYHTCYSLSGATCMQEGYIRERQQQQQQPLHQPEITSKGSRRRLTKESVAILLEGWDEAGAGWGTVLARTDWEQKAKHNRHSDGDDERTSARYHVEEDLGVLSATNPLYNLRTKHVARFHDRCLPPQ